MKPSISEPKLKKNAQGILTRNRPKPKPRSDFKPCAKCGFKHPHKAPWCGFHSIVEYRAYRQGQGAATMIGFEIAKNLANEKANKIKENC